VPWHDGLEELEMVMATGKLGLTFIEIMFDVAGFPVAHEKLEVIWHLTRSPLEGV
jgi:hypothetical protein